MRPLLSFLAVLVMLVMLAGCDPSSREGPPAGTPASLVSAMAIGDGGDGVDAAAARDPFVDLDIWVKAGSPHDDPIVTPIFAPRHHCENCGRPLYAMAARDPATFDRELVKRDDPALVQRLVANVKAEYGVTTALLLARGLPEHSSLWRGAIAGIIQDMQRTGRADDSGAVGHEIRRHALEAPGDATVRGDAMAAIATLPTAPMRAETPQLYSVERASYVLGSPIHADDLRAFYRTSKLAWVIAPRFCASFDASPAVSEALVDAARTYAPGESNRAEAAQGIEGIHQCLCARKSASAIAELTDIFQGRANADPLSADAAIARTIATCAK